MAKFSPLVHIIHASLCALIGITLLTFIGEEVVAGSPPIILGEWRTEPGKSLVCGNSHEALIVKIARSANDFYVKGAKPKSPEYDVYWTTLQDALKGQLCFVTKAMTHQPHQVIYEGSESLTASGKRFKVISTSIKTTEAEDSAFPGFTMTTLKVQPVTRPAPSAKR
jgi:hypothetical protein